MWVVSGDRLGPPASPSLTLCSIGGKIAVSGGVVFGSLGIWEIVFIVILGLLIFGPKKLPEVSRTIGRTLGELRRSAEEFKHTVEREASDVQNSVDTVVRGSASSEAADSEDTASPAGTSEDGVSQDSISQNSSTEGAPSTDLSAGDRS